LRFFSAAPCESVSFFAETRSQNGLHSILTIRRDGGLSQWDFTAMEIKSTGRVETGNIRRLGKGPAAGVFKISDTSEQPRAASLAAPGPLTAVDTILMLQNIDDSTSGAERGEKLLELVREGLLSGGHSASDAPSAGQRGGAAP
jgi:hypothetical protein